MLLKKNSENTEMFHHNISENTEILLSLLLEGDAVVEGQNSLNRIFVPSNRRSFNVPPLLPFPYISKYNLIRSDSWGILLFN